MDPHSDKGFTLLEVVVAVMVLALALGAIYPMYASTPGRLKQAESRALAARVLESEITNQLLLEDWEALPKSGDHDQWQWTLEGTTYAHPSDSQYPDDYLYKVTGTITPTNSRLGAPIVFERIVVRRN